MDLKKIYITFVPKCCFIYPIESFKKVWNAHNKKIKTVLTYPNTITGY